MNPPDRIKETFEKLRSLYPFYIVLTKINDKFYVYRRSTRWDKEKKKIRTISEYIGRITNDGTHIKKALNYKVQQTDSNSIQPVREEIPAEAVSRISYSDDVILRVLSMVGRANLTKLGGIIKMNRDAIYRRVAALERKYGIRYIAEINLENLGYQRYLALVKFEGDRPDANRIKQEIEKDGRIQLVTLTTGKYDMLIYFLAQTNKEVAYFVHGIRTSKVFKKFRSLWYVAPYFDDYGFVPTRNEFFELLKQNIWKRKKDRPKPLGNELTNREYVVLRELNNDGHMEFVAIDKKYGFDYGRTQYTYYTLKKRGIIRRITMTMNNLQLRYNAAILAEVIDAEKVDMNRAKLLKEIISYSESSPMTKYALVGDIETPHSVLFILPVFRNNDLEQAETKIKRHTKGMQIYGMVITSILLGSFCYRRFDSMNSNQYKILVDDYKMIKKKPDVNYEMLEKRVI